jgi:beta-lactamase superfamily II metal-dependent hydrolase
MSDFFEIDFLDVESDKSGDAITIRYCLNGTAYIHVVDGGYQSTGEAIKNHLRKFYGSPTYIDHVVLTHPDGDHAGGLRTILEDYRVGMLWMLRPWNYLSELIPQFDNIGSAEYLRRSLRDAYPNIAALEEIALRKGIPIVEPFQGATIGAFTVLAPSKRRYLDLIAQSDCTPPSHAKRATTLFQTLKTAAAAAVAFVRSAWGEEVFSPEQVSAENEMSVVQYANIAGKKILLTADAGRDALSEAIACAPLVGLALPGIDRFQVPHHGSRRNVSTELLNQLLGPKLGNPLPPGSGTFTAVISSAKKDEHHPRKSVVRAMIHRGARTVATEGHTIRTVGGPAPERGWVVVTPLEYPPDQEE